MMIYWRVLMLPFIWLLYGLPISVLSQYSLLIVPNMGQRLLLTTSDIFQEVPAESQIAPLPIPSTDVTLFEVDTVLTAMDGSSGVIQYDPVENFWIPIRLFNDIPISSSNGFTVAAFNNDVIVLVKSATNEPAALYHRLQSNGTFPLFTRSVEDSISSRASIGIVGGTLVVIGGRSTNSASSTSCRVLNLSDGAWATMAQAPFSVDHCRSCVWDNKMVIIEHRYPMSRFHVFHVASNKWTDLPSIETKGRALPFVVENTLFVVATTGPIAGHVWAYSQSAEWSSASQHRFHIGRSPSVLVRSTASDAKRTFRRSRVQSSDTLVLFAGQRAWSISFHKGARPVVTRLRALPKVAGTSSVKSTVIGNTVYVVDASNDLRYYNAQAGLWQHIATLSSSLDGLTFCGRSRTNDLIFGGGTSHHTVLSLTQNALDTCGPSRSDRFKVASAVIDDVLFIAGGIDRYGVPTTLCEALDPTHKVNWAVMTPLPHALYDATGAAWADRFVVAGGIERKVRSSSVYVLDTNRKVWSELAPLPYQFVCRVTPFAVGEDLYVVVVPDNSEQRAHILHYEEGTLSWKETAIALGPHQIPQSVVVVPASVAESMAAHIPPPVDLTKRVHTKNVALYSEPPTNVAIMFDCYHPPVSIATTSNALFLFDPNAEAILEFDSGSWKRIKINSVDDRFLRHRGAIVSSIGDTLIVAGGADPSGELSTQIWMYTKTKPQGILLPSCKSRTALEVKLAFAFSGTISVGREQIVVFGGGRTDEDRPSGKCFTMALIDAEPRIQKIVSFPFPIENAVTCVWNNVLVVGGGTAASGERLHGLWMLGKMNTAQSTGSWVRLPPLPVFNVAIIDVIPYAVQKRLFVVLRLHAHAIVLQYDASTGAANPSEIWRRVGTFKDQSGPVLIRELGPDFKDIIRELIRSKPLESVASGTMLSRLCSLYSPPIAPPKDWKPIVPRKRIKSKKSFVDFFTSRRE